MHRRISFRTLLLALILVTGLLVLSLALSGVGDALRNAGVTLSWQERSALMRALLSTQLVRGLIGIALALALAAMAGNAVTRLFVSLRTRSRDEDEAPSRVWLREAWDTAQTLGWAEEEHRSRAADLARQRMELDRLIEAVSEGILQLDEQGKVVRANRAARRLLSLPQDVGGQSLAGVVRSAELRGLMRRAADRGELQPREIEFEGRILVVSARRIEGAGLAVAIADLTALRRMENVRREFVANASHELKTPLTSIRGYAETLGDDSLPQETRQRFIETIAANADRLQRIVDDLLDLSRLESGTWQPHTRRVSPLQAAREAWQDFEAQAESARIAFDVRVESPAELLADPAALRQVLSNLYDNALRYTPAGGRIDVRVTEWDDAGPEDLPRPRRPYLAVEVRDTGSGIPGDALPRIFERFYRVDPARSRSEGGTGLGLSIVKHLAESMGGRVEAESLLGRGTTIRIVLPGADARTSGAIGSTPS